MASFNKFNVFVQDLGRKVHNLNSDTLKIELTNTAPVATNTVIANIIDIAAGNGYSAGGSAISGTSFTQTSGTATLAASTLVFTASGGTIPSSGSPALFRYAVVYNSTAAGGPLIGWWDYGSSIVLNDTETFTVNDSAGILTLA